MNQTTLNEISWCKVIRMFRMDRGVETCKWATDFCRQTCYKWKMLGVFHKSVLPKEKRARPQWDLLNAETWREWARQRRKPVERFRFCTRGESFSDVSDIHRIYDVVSGNPGTLFWLPTRAWRSKQLRPMVDMVRSLPNARVQASLDPTTSEYEQDSLVADGWSTMYYGNDGNKGRKGRVLCPKTWFKDKDVHCDTCGLCFSDEPTHVHLKQHGTIKNRGWIKHIQDMYSRESRAK